jgi:hypothetical protein
MGADDGRDVGSIRALGALIRWFGRATRRFVSEVPMNGLITFRALPYRHQLHQRLLRHQIVGSLSNVSPFAHRTYDCRQALPE